MTAYDWVKVVHITAIAIWMGGTLANALALLAVPGGGPPAALATMRRWDRRVTIPAMILTWLAGAVMAYWGGWYVEGWLWTKLAFVLGLTALHGVQSATMRRLAAGIAAPRWLQLSPLAIVGALPIIATLAVAKPF